MNKSNSQQKKFTAITFQGVTVKVMQIIAGSREKSKLIKTHVGHGEGKELKIDNIMEHQDD